LNIALARERSSRCGAKSIIEPKAAPASGLSQGSSQCRIHFVETCRIGREVEHEEPVGILGVNRLFCDLVRHDAPSLMSLSKTHE